jgi:hypothetical protein
MAERGGFPALNTPAARETRHLKSLVLGTARNGCGRGGRPVAARRASRRACRALPDIPCSEADIASVTQSCLWSRGRLRRTAGGTHHAGRVARASAPDGGWRRSGPGVPPLTRETGKRRFPGPVRGPRIPSPIRAIAASGNTAPGPRTRSTKAMPRVLPPAAPRPSSRARNTRPRLARRAVPGSRGSEVQGVDATQYVVGNDQPVSRPPVRGKLFRETVHLG